MEGQRQVALIASGTEPSGQAIARELVRRNWVVVLGGAGSSELQSAAERLATAGPSEQIATCPANLASAADRERLVEFALDEFDRIDLLACVPPSPPGAGENLLELSEEGLRSALEAGLIGPLFLAQRVANEMVRLIEAGAIEAAKIVLVNSIAAYASSTEHAAGCLAAAASGMLTQLLADALSEHGVNVYEVRAGLISTGRGDEVHSRYDRQISEGLVPIRRWGRPQDVALAVAAVAEDLLPYSTGEILNVDGGFHLRRL